MSHILGQGCLIHESCSDWGIQGMGIRTDLPFNHIGTTLDRNEDQSQGRSRRWFGWGDPQEIHQCRHRKKEWESKGSWTQTWETRWKHQHQKRWYGTLVHVRNPSGIKGSQSTSQQLLPSERGMMSSFNKEKRHHRARMSKGERTSSRRRETVKDSLPKPPTSN